jgi:MoxR-like ATPase
VPETGDLIAATQRPVVIITSNAEKELPDAFLRRCIFHFIDFPDRELMARIVEVHHPGLDRQLMEASLSAFFAVRGMDRIRKPPSTSELVDWIAMLQDLQAFVNQVSGRRRF